MVSLLNSFGLPADGAQRGAFRSEVAHPTSRKGGFVSAIRAFGAFSRAGFHRYATYRQATAAAIFTNSVFGFLRTYVLLAAFGAQAVVTGYDKTQMATFVWVGQGVIGVVLLWGWTDVAERVRTGDIASDLLRPID